MEIWNGIKRFRQQKLGGKRREVYKRVSQIISINEMIMKNRELLNTMLVSEIEGDDFDLEIMFKRCSCINKFLIEHKKRILEEIFNIDYKWYIAVTHGAANFSHKFTINYDAEFDVEFPAPTFLIRNRKGEEFADINCATLSLDYCKKDMSTTHRKDIFKVIK